jgi:adenylate cyclase
VRRVAKTPSAHPGIVLVEINDTSIREFEHLLGRWPWPRMALAMIIDFISRAPARAVGVDLLVLEQDNRTGFEVAGAQTSGKASDDRLVASVAKAGNVIMAVDAVYLGTAGGEQAKLLDNWTAPPFRLGPSIEERPMITPPFDRLRQAAAGLGHNLFFLDSDGPIRRVPPFIRVGGRYVPSLGVAAAILASGIEPEEVVLEGRTIRLRESRIPLIPTPTPDWNDGTRSHDQQTMLVNYRAPELVNRERAYKSYPAHEVIAAEDQLAQNLTAKLDPAVFKDKIVFVGQTFSGFVDILNTPFGDVMPGVQIHATMADNVLTNRFISPAPGWNRIAAAIGLAIAVALMATTLPYLAAAAGALLAAGGWTWLALFAFRDGQWLNMVQPLLACAVALFAGTAYQYFVEGAEKRVVKKLFGRYVSKDVYNQLLTNPELAELGGKRREMTVLFSDIRGFTTVTERGDPEELVSQLNEYFSRMVAVVFGNHGTVDKFVGDMVMALFGAPVEDTLHAEHAVATAVEMVKELGELNRKWASEGRVQLDIGIGVNSGEMIAGNIGSSSIMSYTVIGDNVNLGSRLESLNKDQGSRIIISDATRSLLTGQYEIRPLGDVVVKGKTRPVAIFEVVVPSPIQAMPEEAKS